jgi:hypothetical protein
MFCKKNMDKIILFASTYVKQPSSSCNKVLCNLQWTNFVRLASELCVKQFSSTVFLGIPQLVVHTVASISTVNTVNKCSHTKRTSAESSCLKQDKSGWFGKLDGLFSLTPIAVRGTVSSDEDVLLPTKWHLTRGDKIHDNSRSCDGD